jgi:hypothetical protein
MQLCGECMMLYTSNKERSNSASAAHLVGINAEMHLHHPYTQLTGLLFVRE